MKLQELVAKYGPFVGFLSVFAAVITSYALLQYRVGELEKKIEMGMGDLSKINEQINNAVDDRMKLYQDSFSKDINYMKDDIKDLKSMVLSNKTAIYLSKVNAKKDK